jgi:hypothetical protein
LVKGDRHEATLSTVHDFHPGEQPASKAMALQLEKEIRFLAIQEVLFVEFPYGVKRRLSNE